MGYQVARGPMGDAAGGLERSSANLPTQGNFLSHDIDYPQRSNSADGKKRCILPVFWNELLTLKLNKEVHHLDAAAFLGV